MARIVPLLLSLLMALPLSAGIWGSRGLSRQFVLSGTRLYAADGRGVTAYDVSDPASLRVIDVESGTAETVDLSLMDSGTLLAATVAGVDRFAVAEDGTLTRTGGWQSSMPIEKIASGAGFAAASMGRDVIVLERDGSDLRAGGKMRMRHAVLAMAFVGEYLYVSVEGEATHVFAPPSMERLSSISTAPTDFALSGTTLWGVAPDPGMRAIDVSDPRAPVITRKIDLPDVRPTSVAASGSRVITLEPPGRVYLFDVAQDGSATLEATLNEPARAVALGGSYFFLSGALLDGEGLELENGKPLRAWEVASGTPVLVGEIIDRAGPVSGVWTDGSIAYVVDRPFLRVIDVSRTEAPREISAVAIPEIQEQIRVKDGVAAIYGRGVVNLVDVSRPLAPRHLGNWHTQGHPPSVAALAGGKLLEANMHSGLHVVDFSDPENPVQVGGRIWHYSDLVASEDAVYAIQDWGVIVLEFAGATEIIERNRLMMDAEQIEIAPPGSPAPRFLVVRSPAGLLVLSLEDRYSPVEAAFVPADGTTALATDDGAAFAAREGLIHRLDLSNPGPLESTGMVAFSPMQISVAAGKIVVADRYSLRVYGPDTPSRVPARRRVLRH